jgi:diguanylate cyclase (GGDEF)-like protein/PAS domain S-box-containing protein
MTTHPRPGQADPDRQRQIRALLDAYIEMYASRDDRLTGRFGADFSGHTGSGAFLVRDRAEWIRITRQDFAQVPGRIGIEMLDVVLQDLSDDVVVATALFHIHLPSGGQLLAREAVRLVLIFRHEDGDWMIMHSGISVPYHQAQDGEVYPLQSLQQRNTELAALVAERTQALHDSEALYRLLTEDTQDVIWKADAGLRITYISPADERLRGFRADEVIGQHVFGMFTPEGVAAVRQIASSARDTASTGSGFLSIELQHRCKDGSLLWGEVQAKPDRNAHGEIVGYHGITREITQRKLLEAQVQRLAFHDALTHLCNRRLLVDRLSQAMASARRTRRHAALLFLDLDNFKSLNDLHGHAAGDLLLVEVGRRLKACVREVDTVARFGGDEFVLLLCDLALQPDEAMLQAAGVAEKVRLSLAAPYLLQAGQAIEHHCTASIGVALFQGGQASESVLIDHADAAMYRAKDEGHNRVRFHAPQE